MAEVALESAPRRLRDLVEKARAALERQNYDYAMDILMEVLDQEPRLGIARKLLRATAVQKAKTEKGSPIAAAVNSLLGLIPTFLATIQTRKDPVRALQTLEQLLRKDPFNITYLRAYVAAAEAAEMPEAAAYALETARDALPGNLWLLETLAQLYMTLKRLHDARLCYEEIVRLKPNDPKALKQLKDAVALDTVEKGGWAEATSYRDVIKDEKEAVLLEQAAKAVKSEKDVQALIQEMRTRLQREPDNVNYIRTLADLYVRARQYDDAVALLREALQGVARGDPQLERMVSTIIEQKFDDEIAQLEASGQQQAADQKRKEKEDFVFQDAAERVKKYPNDLQFRFEYGEALFRRGMLNEAIQQFQIAQRNPQRRTQALLYLATCFKMKKQYDIALEQLEKANSELRVMDDQKKEVLYEMGTVYELLGQRDKALACFKDIYAEDIGYKDVADKVERVYGEQGS